MSNLPTISKAHAAWPVTIALLSLALVSASHAAKVAQNFDTDPRWKTQNNTAGEMNYGFGKETHIDGAKSGQIGGAIARVPFASYYADAKVGVLTLEQSLSFEGKITVMANRNFDGNVHVGYFDKGSLRDFIGFEIMEPGGLTGKDDFRVRLLAVNAAGNDRVSDGQNVPWQLTPGKDYHFTFAYTPLPNGNGQVSLTIKGLDVSYSASLSTNLLGDGYRSAGSSFNAFGISTPAKDNEGGRLVDVFLDDLTYSVAPKTAAAKILGGGIAVICLCGLVCRRRTFPPNQPL